MVKNLSEGLQSYIEEKIGRSINPYDEDFPLTEDEAREEYDYWMDGAGFQDADKIIYHSSPSEEEVRFELLENVAMDFYSRGENPEIYVAESNREMVQRSDVLHDGAVRYNEVEVTEDDINDSLRFSSSGKSVHVTADYHAQGVEGLREAFDEDEFIVLSADTSDIQPDPADYAGILGPAAPVASEIFGWKTLAEGKEVGRELTEWFRGPRF